MCIKSGQKAMKRPRILATRLRKLDSGTVFIIYPPELGPRSKLCGDVEKGRTWIYTMRVVLSESFPSLVILKSRGFVPNYMHLSN
jgi:hypothetical protein